MTRWTALLDALGVSEEKFEVEHKGKFDMSPRNWLRARLVEIAAARGELTQGLRAPCDRPCCAEVR